MSCRYAADIYNRGFWGMAVEKALKRLSLGKEEQATDRGNAAERE